MPSSIALVASILALTAASAAQSFANGGLGRFPCTSPQGTADQTMCTNAQMTNNQQCPTTFTSGDPVDRGGGSKSDGLVPVSATCTAANGQAYFCGFAGAPCLGDDNCDNGACSGGVCTGNLGAACSADSQCSGNVYCLQPDESPADGTCGGVGAFCLDACAEGNFLCSSNLCDGDSGACVAAGTVGASQRVRTRRTMDLARGGKCPISHTACDLPGSVRGFECIDTQSNLEQCGACANAGGSDCTALPGVDAVGCVLGQCEIWACAEGYAWSADAAQCEVSLS